MKGNWILVISLFVVVLDQVTKAIIRATFELHESVKVLGDLFRFTFVENHGMAFGIQFGRSGFFAVFAAIASLAILIYLYKVRGEKIQARVALALILGGAVGNLIDRILFGKVVDFFDCDFFNIHLGAKRILFFDFPGYHMDRWPVYNIADAAVTIGMVILVIMVIFEKDRETKEIDTDLSNEQMVR